MKLDFEFKLGVFAYQLAQLKHDDNRGWHIMYKVPNDYTGQLERKFIRLNRMRARFEDEDSFLKHANDLVQAINLRLRNNESPYLSDENARCFEPVKTMFEKFLEEKSRYVRPDTYRTYKSHSFCFLNWLDRVSKNCLCMKFTPFMAVKYTEHIKTHVMRINPRTYNDNIKFCRCVFLWGQRHFYFKNNPFKQIRLMTKIEKYREVVTQEQRKQIRAYYEKRCPAYLVVMGLVFNSFIRPREISQIQIKNVDLENNVIHLFPEQTKNRAYRSAILSPELVDILTKELANNYPDDYYLISEGYRPGPTPLTTKAYRKSWVQMRKRLELPDTLQLYSLRDSGIMELLDTELSPREVSEVVGHRDFQSMNNYLHHHSQTLIEKMQRNTPRF